MTLRVRLLLATAMVSLIALLGADIAAYSLLRNHLYGQVDQRLMDATAAVFHEHRQVNPAFLPGPESPEDLAHAAPGTYIRISGAGDITSVIPFYDVGSKHYTPNIPKAFSFPSHEKNASPSLFLTVSSKERGGPEFRVLATQPDPISTLVVAQPLDGVTTTLNHLIIIELLAGLIALIAAMALGWWLVRLGLRPLTEVEESAEAIDAGELDRRIEVANPRSEVGRLAIVLNSMLSRIESAFSARDKTESELRASESRLRRFVGDASHELRTPLAAVSAYAELFSRGASERPEDLARLMQGIQVESARMSGLVDDLLLLARMDEERPIALESLELITIAADAVDAHRALGPAWPITFSAPLPVEMMGDAGRIRQIFDNLLGNVRAHTPEGTHVELKVEDLADSATISVIDHGPGIAIEEREQIFERFYRSDPSRTRSHGGSGLGLSIVTALATAHGGSVSAEETPGGGATIIVSLPKNSQAITSGR